MDELRDHLIQAEVRLAGEKNEILEAHPLSGPCNREEYAFAYVRAERLGVKAIAQRLATMNWLPLQLDVHPEMMGKNREPIKHWIKASKDEVSSEDFGNDFMHALTRVALANGWNSNPFQHLSSRITNLFGELSCLINAAYYCNWLVENNVEKIELTSPDDLHQTVTELGALLQSPSFIKHVREAKKKVAAKRAGGNLVKGNGKPPKLHIIKNHSSDEVKAPSPGNRPE